MELHTDFHKLDRDVQYRILTREPNADPSAYPRTRLYESGAYRQFQPTWLKSYPWLHYSDHSDGAFCRACVFFAPDKVGGQCPGSFVTKPFKFWNRLSDKANLHSSQSYHKISMAKMDEFLVRYKNPSQSISAIVNTETQKVMSNNTKVIESLLKIILLCGKQGLSLRGHRDDHINWIDSEPEGVQHSNQGNFVELVRFRAEHDQILAQHLAKSPRNARYTSKTIQNELIEVVGNSIHDDILQEVKRAKYYSVIADEMADVSNKEQLSLTVRYVLDRTVKEMFVDFIEVERITGESLAMAILHWLHAQGLPASDMRGQCYDGASNMSGACSGCQAIVQQQAPKAMYFHCSAHRLNLAVVSACKIPAFKNAEAYLGEIARFFGSSAKRQRLLDTAVDKMTTPTKAKKLKDACRTRWVQRIDSYAVFEELLPAVHTTLQAMVYPTNFEELRNDWKWDGETITKANGYLYQLEASSFLICFKILLKILSYLREITLKLQMETIDAVYAYKQVRSVVSALKDVKKESTEGFKRVFANTTKLGKDLHGEQFELQKPRVVGRQAHRSNPDVSSVEDYFRITLYHEFLSHVITELQERFLDNQTQVVALGLLSLLPHECIKHDDLPAELNRVVEYYSEDLPHPLLFSTEYVDSKVEAIPRYI